MNKMVKPLRLQRQIVRRFVNDSDDDEVEECESCGSEIEIITGNGFKQSETSFNGLNTSLTEVSKNNKFENYKVFVRNCGLTVQRFVDINVDKNPFITNDTLDQVMGCHDLKQMAVILRKSPSNSHSNPSVPEVRDKQQLKSNVRKRAKKAKNKNKKANALTNDSEEVQTTIKELESEGIYKKETKKGITFNCLVCELKLIGLQLASEHSKCDIHLKVSLKMLFSSLFT